MSGNMKKKNLRRKPIKVKHKKVQMDETHMISESKGLEFKGSLDNMITWFTDHHQEVDQLFSLTDTDTNGSVNMKDFELGLMSLGVPCQQLELHTLTQLLKNAENMITYRDLNRQVQTLRLRESSTEVSVLSEEDCMKRQADGREDVSHLKKERFVRLRVRLIPFDCSAAHPGNFEVVVPTRSKVFSLIRIIQEQVGIWTSRLEVFRSRLPTEEAGLPPESSLEECGFKGGPEEHPPEDTVYYDYRLLFTDCPLLNCDHYFR